MEAHIEESYGIVIPSTIRKGVTEQNRGRGFILAEKIRSTVGYVFTV